MSAVATRTCQLKASFFATCGGESTAVCQYCGRSFCTIHGVVLEDGQEICARKECVAKRDDLQRHFVYKEAVRQRNERDECGLGGCVRDLAAQCVRCKGLFCGDHVRKREETFLQNQVRTSRIATLCQHCSNRRSIWLRS